LDERDTAKFSIYLLVRNQVKLSPMGEVIDLDHKAVLGDIELYVPADEVKETFEFVLHCFGIERELLE